MDDQQKLEILIEALERVLQRSRMAKDATEAVDILKTEIPGIVRPALAAIKEP